MTQFFRVAIIIMALFSSPIAHAGSCLWFADHNFLHQVQTDTNQISQNVLLKEPLGLAMNATDCGVWTLAERALHKYAANGNLAQQIDLNSLLPKVENVRQIAVDPYDNSVWFITENQFYHISASGLLIGSWKAAGSVRRFSLGLDQSLWAIGSKQLWHYDIQGNLLATVNLDGVVKNEPKLLAVDGLGGVLWIAGEKQLIQFSLKVPHPLVLNIALLQPVKDLTLDPSSGTIWLTAEKSLVAYARDGSPLPNIDFTILGIKDIQTLAFDPPSQSLWIGDKSGITRISIAGVVIAKLPALDGPLLIATPPFVVSPILTLIQPSQNALTNNSAPPITFGYDATCSGKPCGFAPAYYSSYSLTALLNNQPIGNLFKFDSVLGQANYTPASRLPEGQNTLTAQAKDSFGHISNSVTNTFTIDTIPPKFLTVTPAEGTVFTTPLVTIQGSIDDPQGVVVLANVTALNSGANPAPSNFTWTLTLKSGLNTFNLSAIDKAGNVATRTLHLTYNPVSVSIADPSPGMSINGNNILVTGTYQGPLNTGITVNGVVAALSGNHFYASVMLFPGQNNVTVIATTPDGGTATQTVSVTSSGISPVAVIAAPTEGVASLKVNFNIVNNTAKVIQKIEVDFDGDGLVDFTTTDPKTPLNFTYTAPGTYRAKITVTDNQNTTSTQIVLVVVHDAAQMDEMFKVLWSGINTALAAQDKTQALQYLNTQAQAKYGPVFEALLPNFPAIVASYSTLQHVSISSEIGEYAVNRTIDGQNRIFLIYFLRDVDGIWRLDSM